MLGITQMPPCGLGNRLIYYYNLRQEAHQQECAYFSIPWKGMEIFIGNLNGEYPPSTAYTSFNFCLGDKFYDYNQLSTREVFKLKEVPNVSPGACAVHFRGGDFHEWNPNAILKTAYYRDSIEEIKNEVTHFILFTDDLHLESYQKTKNFLIQQRIPFTTGENSNDRNHYGKDLAAMSQCDYIISSPSTFCIAGGFIGKKKRIIHSKSWVKNRAEVEDKFWCALHDGGNDDYKLWKLI